jgi:hypothetical protein
MSFVTLSTPAKTRQFQLSRLLWVGPLAGVVAAVGNLILFFIVTNLLNISLIMPMNGPDSPAEPLPALAVIMASFVPALGATFFLWLLGKFTRQAALIFQIIAVAFLLISFGGPLSLPVDSTIKLVLSLMHVVAGVAIVGILIRLGQK